MKILIFLPLLFILVPLLLGILGFFWLVGKMAKNASNDEWRGEIVDTVHNTKNEDDNKVSHFYILLIQTTKGETRKVPVTADVFANAKTGDKYIKVKGKLNPEKII
jgi:hypothetical protein